MTDNGNKQRPVRKLTVENFSVIKHAELEFGKITVLIGPQASGKSLLCKLAFFFQQIVAEQAEEAMKAAEDFEQLRQRLIDRFSFWFGFDSIATETSKVTFSVGSYVVSLTLGRNGQPGAARIQWDFSTELEESYRSVWVKLNVEKLRRESLPNPKYFAEEIRDRFAHLRGQESPEIYAYIPATRALFLSAYQAIFGTARRRDDIELRFSQDFNYGFESRLPKSALDQPLTHWINAESERILQGRIVPAGSDFHFKSTEGRTLMLAELSSGTQELLPLMTCLREYVAASAAVAKTLDLPDALHKRLFFLEEPETNIFPSSQNDLVRILARMSNERVLDVYWVMTTHSPYILSAFNNLILAGQLGQDKRLKKKLKIDEKCWIEPGTFKAYSIHDGKLESILSDTGLINGEYLDSVSETIGNEFDEMLRLEYGTKKAS